MEDNPLRNAPHTAEDVVADELVPALQRGSWPRTRSPRCGADKYWAPVGRIDGAYGDRNLICACPPVEAYA